MRVSKLGFIDPFQSKKVFAGGRVDSVEPANVVRNEEDMEDGAGRAPRLPLCPPFVTET